MGGGGGGILINIQKMNNSSCLYLFEPSIRTCFRFHTGLMSYNEVIKKNVTHVWRDEGELDHFPLCRYRTITQIRTVLRWFCVTTACALNKNTCAHVSYPGPTVIRRHFYSSPPFPSFHHKEFELETLFKSANSTYRFRIYLRIYLNFIFRGQKHV